MQSETPGSVTSLGAARRSRGLFDWASGQIGRFGPILGGTILPFTLVVYLGLRGGGYDAVVRSEVGLAVWWIVLFGALAGVLPLVKLNRAAWVPFCLLAAFAAWTALAMIWTESREETFEELARIGIYLGVFALALSVQNRDGLRRTVAAIGTGIAVVAAFALLSRLHPSWFPADELARAAADPTGRLNYPVNYWNALATLVAMGLPLLVAIAARARGLVAGSLATAALPLGGLVIFYTFSRTGLFAAAAGFAALIALHPRRRTLIPPLVLGGVSSALLIAAAAQRDALESGPATPGAAQQGDEMLAAVLIACAGVALLHAGIGLAIRYELVPRIKVSRRTTQVAAAVVVVGVLGALLAGGAPSRLEQSWEDFKQPSNVREASSRFGNASGNGRYQYWQASLDAGSAAPLTGIGPGAWGRMWEREGEVAGFVRFAHSLYLETFAELGVPGLLLIGGVVIGILALGVARIRRSALERRELLAAALAACTAFALAAALDWTWQVTVVTVAFLFCAAALLVDPSGDPPPRGLASLIKRSPIPQAALGVLAVASVVVIAVSMSYFRLIAGSESAIARDDASQGLERADSAAALQPFAATPDLQRAVALRLAGDLPAAAAAARASIAADATSWRPWYVLYQVEGDRGNTPGADYAYAQARALNPRSALLPSRIVPLGTDLTAR